MNQLIKSWITKLELQSHPEGGYFKETYRSDEIAIEDAAKLGFKGNRNFCTAIYYLLEGTDFSAFHRIKSDEIWHFYTGSPLVIYMIDGAGNYSEITLGNRPQSDEYPQFTVPKNVWFAAKPVEKSSFSLVGCTVSPGFNFADFELAQKANLTNKYPDLEEIILRFCR